MKKLALIAAGWMSLVCATAHSDVIVFKTGVAKVGIIISIVLNTASLRL